MARPHVARPLVAAGAVFRDAVGRVLLVHPTYEPGWEVPGGVVEPGESPAAACHRGPSRSSASTACRDPC